MDLHSIYERSFALEAVGSSLADLVKEIIEGCTEHEHLQNLRHVSKLGNS